MANFLMVNNETGVAENAVVLEDGSTWEPPQGYSLYPTPANVGIGWTYSSGEWIEPPQPQLQDQPQTEGTQEL